MKPRYLNLNEAAFHKKMGELITKGKIGPKAKEYYIECYNAHKILGKTERRAASFATRFWKPVRAPLVIEIRSVQGSLFHYNKDEDPPSFEGRKRRVAALRAYEAYLHTLQAANKLMRAAERSGLTPLQLVAQMKEAGKIVPNNGEHWTDWVSPKARREVFARFDAIPSLPKAKRRVLYPRTTVTPTTTPPQAANEESIHADTET